MNFLRQAGSKGIDHTGLTTYTKAMSINATNYETNQQQHHNSIHTMQLPPSVTSREVHFGKGGASPIT